MDPDKLISNFDLNRFNRFLRGNNRFPTFFHIDELPSIDTMFAEDVYYVILYQDMLDEDVGHWVTLIKWDENTFEYFDCLGDPVRDQVLDRLNEYSEQHNLKVELIEAKREIMDRDNFICGKWTMFRILTLPKTLKEFYNFFDMLTTKRGKKKIHPDDIVDFVISLPYEPEVP